MTTARVSSTKVHDMHHVANLTKPDTMASIESDYHADTICARKNMTLFSYTGYKCNVIGFLYDLKSRRRSQ